MGRNLAPIFLLLLSVSWVVCNASPEELFLKCMSMQSTALKYLFNSLSPEYSHLYNITQQNTRWVNATSNTKPLYIFTPYTEAEIQTAVNCGRKHGVLIRAKSGGHDYEGMSFRSTDPFIILDLVNMRSVNVDIGDESVWVQTGTTLGELYYNIAQKSGVHAFPGGMCPSVGTGGHISGGGFGMLVRKYGLAADNVIDARIVDASGRILDRKAMGEPLFWAIRGGGGASYGIITSWKLKLVRVPPVVTVFKIERNLSQSATKIIHKWQDVANQLPNTIFIQVLATVSRRTMQFKSIFHSLFLGNKAELLQLMKEKFPELGLVDSDCHEMSWVNSTVFFAAGPDQPLQKLLTRIDPNRQSYKAKSDFVKVPIPESGLEEIWQRFMEIAGQQIYMIMDPFGGKMDEHTESKLPFPHRKGNLYNIQYRVQWNNDKQADVLVDWIRRHYEHMEKFVSNSPRATYFNYKDLDLGTNPKNETSYTAAKVWGEKYFKGNFERLARVKSQVDPTNFFRSEQTILPFKN